MIDLSVFDPCYSNPCQNGGYCNNNGNGTYGCSCRSPFIGEHCRESKRKPVYVKRVVWNDYLTGVHAYSLSHEPSLMHWTLATNSLGLGTSVREVTPVKETSRILLASITDKKNII